LFLFRVILVSFLLVNTSVYSQDSIAVKDLTEDKEIRFQGFLFKALTSKANQNYKEAIVSLEECQQIFPDDVTVLFELSKNYLLLNKSFEAKELIKTAISKKPQNIWLLEHLVKVYKKDSNWEEAIKVQLKIVDKSPKKKQELAQLYYLNREYNKAIHLIDELQKNGGVSRYLKELKTSLMKRKTPVKKEEGEGLVFWIEQYQQVKSFKNLMKILDLSKNKNSDLFKKYSNIAVEVFPEQPKSYLMMGESLKLQQKFDEAIQMLEVGLDFVIDNKPLQTEFYTLLVKVYTQTQNLEQANKYRQKMKLLNKK